MNIDFPGLLFIAFTGIGALYGLALGGLLGGIAGLLGLGFAPVAHFTLAFCTGVGAVAGLLAEIAK